MSVDSSSRFNRIDDAIIRLTDVASDIRTMLAAHEQRIQQSEKTVVLLEESLEKRREEFDTKLKDVYDTMRTEDKNILDELKSLRQESSIQHVRLTEKLNAVEKYIWMYMGGFTVISLMLAHGDKVLKILN
jgi:hypothetical protein